jgi:predicted flap endonuclease-1-like 5' DNA nuclease
MFLNVFGGLDMKIEKIEGIGSKYGKTLRKYGIATTEALLKKGATRKGRQEIVKGTKISKTLILEWVNLSDLMRIKGVGEEYSDLLEEAGVDTVKELRHRSPKNLHKKILETNTKKKLVRRPPALSMVEDWVQQAKALKPVLSY